MIYFAQKQCNMEQEYKQSEFVVSENTAQWVRILKSLIDVWSSVSVMTNYNDVEEDPYYPHFKAIEELLTKSIGDTITNNLGWKDFPDNMI